MAHDFHVGDHVERNTTQGKTRGRIAHRRPWRKLLAAAALAAVAAGCARAAGDPGAAPPPVSAAADAAARDEIARVSSEFSARYMRGDIAGLVALYTEDGVALPPGRTAIQGPGELTRYWTLAPGVDVLHHAATPDSIVVAGPVAYDWGTYTVRVRNAEGAVRDTHGKYVIVWRETRPGTWRMHVDMWNAGPAPAP